MDVYCVATTPVQSTNCACTRGPPVLYAFFAQRLFQTGLKMASSLTGAVVFLPRRITSSVTVTTNSSPRPPRSHSQLICIISIKFADS